MASGMCFNGRAFHSKVGDSCERVLFLFIVCARVHFVTGAGWVVVLRADEIRALSCTTEASSVSFAALFG
jgi:hypothetical protein